MLGNFGKSRHRVQTKDTVNVSFKDVAGVQEAKEDEAEYAASLARWRAMTSLRAARATVRAQTGVLAIAALTTKPCRASDPQTLRSIAASPPNRCAQPLISSSNP